MTHILHDPAHDAWLRAQAHALIDTFRPSVQAGRIATLGLDGRPLPDPVQELHTVTRLVHSFALAKAFGAADVDGVIDVGMEQLLTRHRDAEHGGYVWSVDGTGVADGTKLAYGHVFVLLAASSALTAGHPDARRLLDDVLDILDRHYWDEEAGLFRDEFTRDWQPFSSYRGMNANMHGVEALLTAHEATGDARHLQRAGRILDFFTTRIAPNQGWRIPEHYTETWEVDAAYSGNPMFRPAGTTPGHSLELGRLLLQHWDLTGRRDPDGPRRARRLVEQAQTDAWRPDGGFVYTLGRDGQVAIPDRYWWPVTEGIGALSALIKADPQPQDAAWYDRLWTFADRHLIDHAQGGWFPELDEEGKPVSRQFLGKPDIYHALQATLLPLVPGLSRLAAELADHQAGGKT
ncbi:AGE family epimerase/isomerase [Falsirhodobacter sp. 1013]|uniref:AGE family epimerase/isomerase n=1 Tax=Falsirhodobacter sp. 1013 TaxID=3417566 RepID=UPI003EB86924